jgi:hypothetical protein
MHSLQEYSCSGAPPAFNLPETREQQQQPRSGPVTQEYATTATATGAASDEAPRRHLLLDFKEVYEELILDL